MNTLLTLVAALLVLTGVCVQPRSAQCPPEWYLSEGIRRSGAFVCHEPLPAGLDDGADGAAGGFPVSAPQTRSRNRQPPDAERELPGRIYCTGGARPIVVDQRTVGCQRGREPR